MEQLKFILILIKKQKNIMKILKTNVINFIVNVVKLKLVIFQNQGISNQKHTLVKLNNFFLYSNFFLNMGLKRKI
jgi:hypothetical protein